jgi:hypothetical protein
MRFYLLQIFIQNFIALCYDRNFQHRRKCRANIMRVMTLTEFKMTTINHYLFNLFSYPLISYSLVSYGSTRCRSD